MKAIVLAGTFAFGPAGMAAAAPELVSVDSHGRQGDATSQLGAISHDGRYIAFTTKSRLAPADQDHTRDAYLHDRETGRTALIPIDAGGGSVAPVNVTMSADARLIAFESRSPDAVSGDDNGTSDVFVFDRSSGRVERVSVGPHGRESDDKSYQSDISANGRYVAYASFAHNLVAGGARGNNIYVYDRRRKKTTLVSAAVDGSPTRFNYRPSVSNDGLVAFESAASNLVAGDTNRATDIFVRDLATQTTTRASVNSAGEQTRGMSDSANVDISANGRYAAFDSFAENLDGASITGVFVRDLVAHTTRRVSVAPGGAPADGAFAEISDDGGRIAFRSNDDQLTQGNPGADDTDPHIFVFDQSSGQVFRVDERAPGAGANRASYHFRISGNGRVVTFDSNASDLVDGDGNRVADTFAAPEPWTAP